VNIVFTSIHSSYHIIDSISFISSFSSREECRRVGIGQSSCRGTALKRTRHPSQFTRLIISLQSSTIYKGDMFTYETWMDNVKYIVHKVIVGYSSYQRCDYRDPRLGLYPAVCFRGSMKLSGGPSSGRRPRVEARSAERGRGLWAPSPGMGVRGYHPGKILKFETQFGAIWCILARN